MMCVVSMFPSVRLAAFVSPYRLRGCLRVGTGIFARPCARGVICDVAPKLASRQVVPAPCCCVASCACIGIVSQGLAKSCISKLSVLPQSEVSLSGEDERCKKMGFPAAIREKSQCWVALSCDAHLVSAGLGRIRQPCSCSSSEWDLVRTFF